MEYCSVTDVERYYQGKSFNYSDYITNAEIETFIIQEATLINGILRKRYVLPITDHDDLMFLKMINEKLVVGTVDDITREKNDKGEFERGRNTRKEALEWLDKIRKGEFSLNANQKNAPVKFNNVDSRGNTVVKKFSQSDIEPHGTTYFDRERRRWVHG